MKKFLLIIASFLLILSSSLAIHTEASSTKTYYVTASKVNVRSGAGTNYKILGSLSKNTKITVNLKTSNGWYSFKYKGKKAYISGKYVATKMVNRVTVLKASGTYYVTVNGLTVRAGAGTSYKKLGSLSKGSKISINGKASNGWYRFTYKGKKAYISKSYVSTKKPVTAKKSVSKYTIDSKHKTNAFEQELLKLINEKRKKAKLNTLTTDNRLNYLSRLKAIDIGKTNNHSHTSKTYGTPFQMLKNYGVSYKVAGENLAGYYATPSEVLTAWENSPGHRAILYDKRFTHFGVGYSQQGQVWTALFIKK